MFGARPSPVQTPPTVVGEDVTKGYLVGHDERDVNLLGDVPKSRSDNVEFAPSTTTRASDANALRNSKLVSVIIDLITRAYL